jgi:hypothetical protein
LLLFVGPLTVGAPTLGVAGVAAGAERAPLSTVAVRRAESAATGVAGLRFAPGKIHGVATITIAVSTRARKKRLSIVG